MNAAIRRTAFFLGLAFAVLFANINVIQAYRADELSDHPRNRRNIIREFGTRRGEILAADNTILAHSVRSDDPRYQYVRRYPGGMLYGHLTGYYSFLYGASGLEGNYNDVLLGREPARVDAFIDELLGKPPAGNSIRLTVDPVLQELASDLLQGQRGGAAVIDSKTGAILALYGEPGFDPSPLAGSPNEGARMRAAWARITSAPGNPLRSNAFAERYPPGSSFKVVTAAAGLLNGMTSSTSFPDPSVLDLPDSNQVLPNWQGGPCAGGGTVSMTYALTWSCNTYFAQVAMQVGAPKLQRAAERFGFGSQFDIGVDVTASCVQSIAGGGCNDASTLARPFTAYSGIGQYEVGVTPLQMAIVAGVVENDGVRAEPYLVERIIDPTGQTIAKTEPKLRRILPKPAAAQLDDMMVEVVQSGTGTPAGFSDPSSGAYGGKTGTAEAGDAAPHVWFIAYGPGVSAAVVVENGGDLGNEATGGRVAGPIARALIERAIARKAYYARLRAGQTRPTTSPSPSPSLSEAS